MLGFLCPGAKCDYMCEKLWRSGQLQLLTVDGFLWFASKLSDLYIKCLGFWLGVAVCCGRFLVIWDITTYYVPKFCA
jgi:hypothetical protein